MLLIVTDGVISDMAQTKESIVNVSRGHSVLDWLHDNMVLLRERLESILVNNKIKSPHLCSILRP